MKKIRNILILFVLILSTNACQDDILNLESLEKPGSSTFFSNADELDLALTGAYNSLIWFGGGGVPAQILMDNGGTDIGMVRSLTVAGLSEQGQGTISSQTGSVASAYSHLYRGIGRTNNILENLDRAAGELTEAEVGLVRGQALTLRAYFYHYLVELFGDVPYIDVLPTSAEESFIPRTEKATIVDQIMADLQTAAGLLPVNPSRPDRITKGVALGLKARIALYNGKYSEAATAAKSVMDIESEAGYILDSDYKDLFQLSGENSMEIMLRMPFQEGFGLQNNPRELGTRCQGGWSRVVPTQVMIDSYEATDGLPIDESAVYDPSTPFANRDPRLNASIILPGTPWAGVIFESHPDSLLLRVWNPVTSTYEHTGAANQDSRLIKWPACFCGYLWKKYANEQNAIDRIGSAENDIILMRYAEILLIYAEAKIEAGAIDATVLNAINRIRARAYGVDVGDVGNYPAITTTDQSELRRVIRRERKVELANEGFRIYDIRRWRIAEKVVPVVIYGRILDEANATLIPDIDEDGHITYDNSTGQWDRNTDARFPNGQSRTFISPRDYLSPIPQAEIDTYMGSGFSLEQNTGF